MEGREVAIADELTHLQPAPRLPANVLEDRLSEWRRLLRQGVEQGRAVLQRIIKDRITFTPYDEDLGLGEGYEFFAETRFDKLFNGVVVTHPYPMLVVKQGIHPGPESNAAAEREADYGRLLETALKGWRPQRDSTIS